MPGPQAHQELIGLDVLVAGEELVEEGLPFGRQLQAPPFQILPKNFALPGAHGSDSCDCD